jgi:hypothetical protein
MRTEYVLAFNKGVQEGFVERAMRRGVPKDLIDGGFLNLYQLEDPSMWGFLSFGNSEKISFAGTLSEWKEVANGARNRQSLTIDDETNRNAMRFLILTGAVPFKKNDALHSRTVEGYFRTAIA